MAQADSGGEDKENWLGDEEEEVRGGEEGGRRGRTQKCRGTKKGRKQVERGKEFRLKRKQEQQKVRGGIWRVEMIWEKRDDEERKQLKKRGSVREEINAGRH